VQQVTGGVAVVSASNLPPGRRLRPIHPRRENFIVAACCTALHPLGEIVARPDRTFSDFFGRRARRNGAEASRSSQTGQFRTSSDIVGHRESRLHWPTGHPRISSPHLTPGVLRENDHNRATPGREFEKTPAKTHEKILLDADFYPLPRCALVNTNAQHHTYARPHA